MYILEKHYKLYVKCRWVAQANYDSVYKVKSISQIKKQKEETFDSQGVLKVMVIRAGNIQDKSCDPFIRVGLESSPKTAQKTLVRKDTTDPEYG